MLSVLQLGCSPMFSTCCICLPSTCRQLVMSRYYAVIAKSSSILCGADSSPTSQSTTQYCQTSILLINYTFQPLDKPRHRDVFDVVEMLPSQNSFAVISLRV